MGGVGVDAALFGLLLIGGKHVGSLLFVALADVSVATKAERQGLEVCIRTNIDGEGPIRQACWGSHLEPRDICGVLIARLLILVLLHCWLLGFPPMQACAISVRLMWPKDGDICAPLRGSPFLFGTMAGTHRERLTLRRRLSGCCIYSLIQERWYQCQDGVFDTLGKGTEFHKRALRCLI